jgi:hypothetical protein
VGRVQLFTWKQIQSSFLGNCIKDF